MRKRFSLIQLLGFLLIALAMSLLLAQQVLISRNLHRQTEILRKIQSLLPERTTGTMADYSDPEMPVFQVDGKDYVCLLEVPSQAVCLPVENQWRSGILAMPVGRFWGSIYDGTLILGGGNEKGQLEFCGRLDIGDQIILTDMQGTEFSCKVSRIDRSRSADLEKLADQTYPLTLFVREPYDQSYIIVRCDWEFGA